MSSALEDRPTFKDDSRRVWTGGHNSIAAAALASLRLWPHEGLGNAGAGFTADSKRGPAPPQRAEVSAFWIVGNGGHDSSAASQSPPVNSYWH